MIPKFRVWEHDVKFMNDQVRITYNRFRGNKIFVEVTEGVGWKDVDEKYLMQSTGLHDKNGKEIFEGDVVKVSQDDDYFISFVKNMIEFDYPGFDVPFPDDWNYECNVLSYLMNTDQTIEVIGNIHEHPELLENI
ncbi:YopX family protein [Macrococcus sp. S115]|uniref:YopX family protein n=1 Tax=Macrococcus sp. S115 TaxID=3047480 RepID=UPI0024BC3417|nr:YopX family protein [Macrococcus sp. S115]MDJ1110644.1 YopX family protein [Macrococcus sp. S115]